MTPRPILFSGPMVRAIIEGRKTQTRRVLKYHGEQPMTVTPSGVVPYTGDGGQLQRALQGAGCKCPFGQPGERLWVRETFTELDNPDNPGNARMYYAATDTAPELCDGDGFAVLTKTGAQASPWKPSIHMPRAASRITLEVTAVRVERLQDISEADAIAEGIGQFDYNGTAMFAVEPKSRDDARPTAAHVYRELWQSINGPDSWAANPWVWVVEFKRVQQEQTA